MYYILEANNDLKKVRHLIYDNAEGWGMDFLTGHSIDVPIKHGGLLVQFECEKCELPDFFEVDGAPVANNKLIRSFEAAEADNFQAFPVSLKFTDGIVDGYYVFNIIGRISCIDVDATKARKFGPSIMRIFDLKLNPAAAYGATMFRDHKYQMVIFVSGKIKTAIEESHISGCDMRVADGWNDSHRF